MAILYQHPLDVKDELPQMVAAWNELCRDIPDEDFIAACKRHLRRSRFFPCPADIIAAAEECRPVRAVWSPPEPPERKTPGIGLIYRDALRGDMDARTYVETLRRQAAGEAGGAR